ncbi:MAG: hypothetical protein HY716_12855 [Planctomycetes bacterium]|nr:hypothetical protein [Planctomycetota bacterium]
MGRGVRAARAGDATGESMEVEVLHGVAVELEAVARGVDAVLRRGGSGGAPFLKMRSWRSCGMATAADVIIHHLAFYS